MPSKKKLENVFLNPDYTDAGRHFIMEYLNGDKPDLQKVVDSLKKLYAFSDKVIFSEYDEQVQVSAFFEDEAVGTCHVVSGKGKELDLAILSCFSKCEYTLDWTFGISDTTKSTVSKPLFS